MKACRCFVVVRATTARLWRCRCRPTRIGRRTLRRVFVAALSVDARFDGASDGVHLCSAILVALLYGLRGADRRMERDVGRRSDADN